MALEFEYDGRTYAITMASVGFASNNSKYTPVDIYRLEDEHTGRWIVVGLDLNPLTLSNGADASNPFTSRQPSHMWDLRDLPPLVDRQHTETLLDWYMNSPLKNSLERPGDLRPVEGISELIPCQAGCSRDIAQGRILPGIPIYYLSDEKIQRARKAYATAAEETVDIWDAEGRPLGEGAAVHMGYVPNLRPSESLRRLRPPPM